MASVEFLQKRIEGAKKNIATLEKKLERILKAEESNYEQNNPYMYDDYDKRVTTRELDEARKNLEKYEAELQTTQEKDASRNIQVIINFLEQWKARVYATYEKAINEAKEMFDEIRQEGAKYSWKDQDTDEYKAYLEKRKEYHCHLNGWYKTEEHNNPWTNRIEKQRVKEKDGKWEFISRYYDPAHVQDGLNKLKKELEQEAKAKYDFIIERTNKIVGQITDASNLSIGNNGELNGIIIGTRGKAKVTTIGAGGWNIQTFHYRLLVHEVK